MLLSRKDMDELFAAIGTPIITNVDISTHLKRKQNWSTLEMSSTILPWEGCGLENLLSTYHEMFHYSEL